MIRIPLAAILVSSAVFAAQAPTSSDPGRRVLLDAHNAYPYEGRWADRVDRALATGLPIAIEQDLVWRPGTGTKASHSIVSHGEPFTGHEPTLRDFFERLRPLVTRALQSGSRDDWPIVTVNLDFKDRDPQHFKTIWRLLDDYEPWLMTALRVSDESSVQPLDIKPVLVLTGADPAQAAVFHAAVPVGSRLRLFGAVPPASPKKTNYLRWLNYPWSAVEPEGQNKAEDWSESDAARLRRLVEGAHDAGLWIRFYTLNGHPAEEGDRMGWSAGYNFMSIEAARVRWRAAVDAGVDFIATDQYEELARATSRR
jgi:hypothetical protein